MAMRGGAVAGLVLGTAVLSVLGTLAGVVVWSEVRDSLSPDTVDEVCDVDGTLSGFQGWCVQHRRQAGGLVHEQQDWVYVVGVQDGAEISRITYAPWPFVDADAELDVRFESDRIVLVDDEGVEVAYPQEYYALD
ncbi:hypothetical protein [Angustibacter speluncae]